MTGWTLINTIINIKFEFMNKRIFTLLTAGLLLGGPAFNAAYAATDLTTKTVISY